jgi:hypothetical protein
VAPAQPINALITVKVTLEFVIDGAAPTEAVEVVNEQLRFVRRSLIGPVQSVTVKDIRVVRTDGRLA